jgi:hypothetical protein
MEHLAARAQSSRPIAAIQFWDGVCKSLVGVNAQLENQNADEGGFPGRASREEEDAQGPCQEEDNIHSPIRQCHPYRRQEEGQWIIYEIQKQSTADVATDEPQPNFISIHRSSG